MCTDCVSDKRFALSPEALSILQFLDGRTGTEEIAARQPQLGDTAAIADLVEQLARSKVVTRQADVVWPWTTWMPEGAFFHFGTRASRFPDDREQHDRRLREKAVSSPPPAPVKTLAGAATTLPAPIDLGELTNTLRQRRTWRNFSGAKVPLAEIATLLQLTFGVQKWGSVAGQGRVVLKTSPSAGARHPLEAYLLAANVKGLAAGVYHYDAARHQLVALKQKMSQRVLSRVLANQDYFADAAAAVVMSAVFARSMWKYPSSRAYRAILIDAGHLGQTFCLAATALAVGALRCLGALLLGRIDVVDQLHALSLDEAVELFDVALVDVYLPQRGGNVAVGDHAFGLSLGDEVLDLLQLLQLGGNHQPACLSSLRITIFIYAPVLVIGRPSALD